MPRRRIDALLSDYGASHTSRGNLACHAAGITLIVFGILSMLRAVPIAGGWAASEALIAVALLFYVALDPRLGLAVAVALILLDMAARGIGNWRVGAGAFVVGWIFQAIGHAVYEKNSPAFFRNLVHLLVGPAYLVNEALRIRPVSSEPR